MSSEINIISYLPTVLQETKDYKAVAVAENPELNLLQDRIALALADQYVDTAAESGIKRIEKIAKIYPKVSDTLVDRKAAILLKYNLQLPYTYRTLEQKLIAFYGMDGFKIKLEHEQYRLSIEVFSANWNTFNDVMNQLDEIVPMNLEFKPQLTNEITSAMYIGSASIVGEEIVIYPYRAEAIESKLSVQLALSQATGAETITTYPK